MSLFTSQQRWISEGGKTIPEALRHLADAMEQFEEPVDESLCSEESDTVVTISFCDEDANGEWYRAGICMSWTPA